MDGAPDNNSVICSSLVSFAKTFVLLVVKKNLIMKDTKDYTKGLLDLQPIKLIFNQKYMQYDQQRQKRVLSRNRENKV